LISRKRSCNGYASAALAVENNAVPYTADNDFSCFQGVQILPLQQLNLAGGRAIEEAQSPCHLKSLIRRRPALKAKNLEAGWR
jgi:hypothetical protein